MIRELTTSSMLAAQELAKDINLSSAKDFQYLENYKYTLDFTNGKKLIEAIGNSLFDKIKEQKDIADIQRVRRAIIMKFLKDVKPPYIFAIPKGSFHFLNCISENFRQVFEDAKLLIAIDDLSNESREIREWWDDISNFVRTLAKNEKLELGRNGEEKTFNYEVEKLNKLKINKKPKWDGFYDNMLGYDIQSWDNKSNKIFIEAKASSSFDGKFHLSRNQWNFSVSEQNAYFIYVWIQNKTVPRIINFKELESYILEDKKSTEWKEILITPKANN